MSPAARLQVTYQRARLAAGVGLAAAVVAALAVIVRLGQALLGHSATP